MKGPPGHDRFLFILVIDGSVIITDATTLH